MANSNRGIFNKGLSSNDYSIYDKATSVPIKSIGGNLFLIIFLIIFIVSFGRVCFHYSEPLTLSTFLSILQNAPSITFVRPFNITIDNEWAILDGLRQFINIFANMFEVICWVGNLLVEVMEYIVYLLVNLLGIRL